jgi:hypothetical protein
MFVFVVDVPRIRTAAVGQLARGWPAPAQLLYLPVQQLCDTSLSARTRSRQAALASRPLGP